VKRIVGGEWRTWTRTQWNKLFILIDAALDEEAPEPPSER
jgi:hypothetical protein